VPDQDYYTSRQQALLDMCKDRLSMIDGADLALDNKLMALVGLSSLSPSLATLALSAEVTPPVVGWLLVVAFAVLALIVFLALLTSRAQRYTIPADLTIAPTKINDRYVTPEIGEVLSHITADYLEVTRDRLLSTDRKGTTLNRCLALYMVQLVLLAGAVGVTLLGPK